MKFLISIAFIAGGIIGLRWGIDIGTEGEKERKKYEDEKEK